MVSGVKRERRKEVVSLPPEKTRSTATAEPKTPEHFYGTKYEEIVPGINVACKPIQAWELGLPSIPPLNGIGVRGRARRVKITSAHRFPPPHLSPDHIVQN